MNIKVVTGLIIISGVLATGCSQAKKPLASGGGQDGAVEGHSHDGEYHTHANIPGHRHEGGGAGSGTGSAQGGSGGGFGGGFGGGGGSGSAQGGTGGSGYGRGQGGSGSGHGGGGANDYAQDGTGSFGGGAPYSGNTKDAYTPADLRDAQSILAQRIIYFGYNQSGIEPQYRRILDAHAALLNDFPDLNVRLEGHADERGSRDYNVALSERRAFAVRDYMQVKGVNKGQMDVVGYGEEVPATFGHGEGSWSKNRRVEIIYAGE